MVIILLATYNGEKYLRQQLDSLIHQSNSEWNLFIRDDGSSDKTLNIIDEYSNRDSRIKLIKDDLGNLRSSLNFNALMEYCQDFGKYFMFCDQDDVWFETKVEETLKQMIKIEKNMPSLVFGTQTLVSENMDIISEMPRNFGFELKLPVLLASNFVYGCTMMINRELLKKCISIPKSAENHDYWISLIAATCKANTHYISDPLMYYRQHGNNVSGNFNDASFSKRLERFKENKEIDAINRRVNMFKDLLKHSAKWINQKDSELLKNYYEVVPKGGMRALLFVLKNKIKKITSLSTLNFYISILRG